MPRKIKGQNTEDIILNGVGDPTYKKLDKFLDAFGSAGIFEGGTISDSGSGQIDVSAAKGVIRTSDSDVGVLVAFDIDEETNITLTDNSMNYIYIDYNSGSPIYAVTTDYNAINFNTQVIVGRVYRSGSSLNIANIGQYIADHILRDLYRIQYTRRLEWGSGSALGFVTATRQPTVGAGVYFSNYTKVSTAAFDASGTDRFTYWYRNGSGGWTQVATQQNIDNANYDSGTGTLTALGDGDYGVHWVYQLTDGTIHIQYGQATYTSIANARNSTVPSSQPPVVVGIGVLIGRIIILKNATAIYETSSAFSYTFTGTATTNHNDLANIDGGGTYHLSAPVAPSTARYRNITAIDNGETVRSNKALFDDSKTPAMDGSVSTGVEMTVARIDHVHPSDTSKAPIASPTFTGTVTTPSIKITGGTPGSGKVLTSDADGDGTWQDAAGDWATKTTAAMSIYVDSAATGAADGTSYTDAFTDIQDAINSLPTVLEHAVTIYVRKGASAYGNTTIRQTCGKGSLTIRGEYYWHGNCAAAATPSTTKFNTAAHTDGNQIAAGDRIFITDGYGADDNYNHFVITTVVGTVNKGSDIWEVEITDAADWGNIGTNCYYTILKTSVGAITVTNTEQTYFYGLQSVLGEVVNFTISGKSISTVQYCYFYSTFLNANILYPSRVNLSAVASVSNGKSIDVYGYCEIGGFSTKSLACIVSFGSSWGISFMEGSSGRLNWSFIKGGSGTGIHCNTLVFIFRMMIIYGTTTGITATLNGVVGTNASYPNINKATTPINPASSTANPYIGA